MTQLDWKQAAAHARQTALEAWSAICHFHGGAYEIEHKKDGPSTDADKLADRLIVASLQRRYPPEEFGYLSEEFVRDPIRLERRAVWIVDPIDGTKDFIRGSGDFAIQIGLVVEEGGVWNPVAGVVYHPLAGRLYWAVRGEGAFVDAETGIGENAERDSKSAASSPAAARWWHRAPDETPRPAESAQFLPSRRLVVSETAELEQMAAVVSASHQTRRLIRVMELIPFQRYYARGSVGVKLAEIALRRADVYVNTERGHCKEWDLCGPHIILTEAGGRVTTLDGGEIHFNREDVRLPGGILASNGRIHDELVAAIGPLTL